MKSLIIAAVVSLALPALAATEAEKSAPQAQPQKTTPAQQKAAKASDEKLASEGISKDVTFEAGPAKPAADKAQSVEHPTLRFERWVRDEDKEY